MDVSEMQRKLSQRATEEHEHKFKNLYSLRCNEVWLRVAAYETMHNRGSNTAGVDGKTKSNFLGDLDGNIERLKEQLKAKNFARCCTSTLRIILSVRASGTIPSFHY